MNVLDLITLAQDANTSATVIITPVTLGKGVKPGVAVNWHHKCGPTHVVITGDMLDADRWPHFSIRSYLCMAAEKMARDGGTPNRKSPLFVTPTEVLDYQRQKELLDMKLAAGVIGPQNYADQLAVLLCRRNADNALWFGANRDG